MQKEIHMELSGLFLSVAFFFYLYPKELGQYCPELDDMLYTCKKGKPFYLLMLFWGRQYKSYVNFSYLNF